MSCACIRQRLPARGTDTETNDIHAMKRLTTLFLLATAVGLAACNKDGVITARPEPVITLDSPDGIYTVKAGRRITITPAVENGELHQRIAYVNDQIHSCCSVFQASSTSLIFLTVIARRLLCCLSTKRSGRCVMC